MAFTETELLSLISALPTATPASIYWRELTVDFRNAARDVILYGGGVESTGPYCRVTPGQIEEHGIEHETVITIGTTDYLVMALNEEQSGFVRLNLTRA
jgi:hypothetical protein